MCRVIYRTPQAHMCMFVHLYHTYIYIHEHAETLYMHAHMLTCTTHTRKEVEELEDWGVHYTFLGSLTDSMQNSRGADQGVNVLIISLAWLVALCPGGGCSYLTPHRKAQDLSICIESPVALENWPHVKKTRGLDGDASCVFTAVSRLYHICFS